MRRTGRLVLVWTTAFLLAVDPAAACRFRLFRRACCNPCPVVYCEPCPPVDCCGADEGAGTTVTIESHELPGPPKAAKPTQPGAPRKAVTPDAPTAPLPPPEKKPAAKPSEPALRSTRPEDELPVFDLPGETPKATTPKSTKPEDELPDFDLPSDSPAAKPVEKPAAPAAKPAAQPADELPDFDLPAAAPKTKPATNDVLDFDLPDESPKSSQPAAKPAVAEPQPSQTADEELLDLPGDDMPADDDSQDQPADAGDDLQLDLDEPTKKAGEDVDDLFEDPTTQTDVPAADELAIDDLLPGEAPAGDSLDELFDEPQPAADDASPIAADGEMDFDLTADDAAPAGPEADDAEPTAAQDDQFDPLSARNGQPVEPTDKLALAEPCSLEQAAEREWTDNTGRFRVQARLVELQGGQVRLLKDTGKYTTVPLARLSASDRAYVEQFGVPGTVRTAQAF